MKLDVTVRESSVPPSVKFGAEAMAPQFVSNQNKTDSCKKNNSSRKDITITGGKTVKISLVAKGIPKPEVTWYKDGKQLRTGNR